MTWDIGFVFLLIAAASLMFASGRVRLDVVALSVVLALGLSGILSVREAVAGFGDPVVILVAGLLVVGEMLVRTGIAHSIGVWLMRKGGGSEPRQMSLLMLAAAGLGSVMSSTAVVAILIPVVTNIARKTKLHASRLLMPMCYGALISGMLTLIATTPNLVVSAELERTGHAPFNFFSITPIGLAVLVVAVLYMLTIGRRLLPGEGTVEEKGPEVRLNDLLRDFGVSGKFHLLKVKSKSPLVGKTLGESHLGSRHGTRVLAAERKIRWKPIFFSGPSPDFEIHSGDVLAVQIQTGDAGEVSAALGLELRPIHDKDSERLLSEAGMATVMIHPESFLLGKTIESSNFRSRYGLHVLAMRRRGKVLEDLGEQTFERGDALLVMGSWDRIGRLRSATHDFVVFALPAEIDDIAPVRRRAPVAIIILSAMVLVSALELIPVTLAVLLAALAAVLTGCLTMEDGYRSIHWSSLVLIAGMLPIADAMAKTGGVDLIVNGLVSGVGGAGPLVMMSALFLLTAAMGLFLSNTATAVLMAPIAIRAAEALEVSPYTFVMTVAIAASAAFMTPVSSPVVTLVVAPGKYRFVDFLKVGVPLLLLTWVVTMLVTPLVFPF